MEGAQNTAAPGKLHPTEPMKDFFWPCFLQTQIKVVNKSKYGFELILPGYKYEPTNEMKTRKEKPEVPNPSPSPETREGEANTAQSNSVDFEELDRLFGKVKKLKGKIKLVSDFDDQITDSPQLRKRPPQGRGKAKRNQTPNLDDSSSFRSSDSKIDEENSESLDNYDRRYKIKTDGRRPENQATKDRVVGQNSKAGQARLHQASSAQNPASKDRGNSKPTIIPLPVKTPVIIVQSSKGEWPLISCLRDLILHDIFSTDRMKLFTEFELDIVLRILRLRYKGAEYFRYPSRTKNINPENNKCNVKFLNEKKLLGEFWPMIMDEIKNRRNIWRVEKEESVIAIFNIYHKNVYYKEIEERTSQALFSQVENGDVALLINLYAELYLNFPP